MIRGWIGWRRYVLDHITRATRPDPPTITTGGRPMRAYPTDIATATNRIAAVTLRTCVRLVVFMTDLRSWRSLRPLRGRAGARARRSGDMTPGSSGARGRSHRNRSRTPRGAPMRTVRAAGDARAARDAPRPHWGRARYRWSLRAPRTRCADEIPHRHAAAARRGADR